MWRPAISLPAQCVIVGEVGLFFVSARTNKRHHHLMRGDAVAGGRRRGRPPDGASCIRRAGLQQCKSCVEMCIVSCLSAAPACVCGRGAATWGCPRALVVVCLAVVTLPPRSTAPTVFGCRLVCCSVVSGRPLRSRAVAEVSRHVCVGLGPVLASHDPSLPAAAAAAWRGRGRVHIAGWSYGGIGPVRGLRGGGRGGWCEEWARSG